MFLFSSDRIRFVVPLVGSESSQNLAGARATLTDDSRRFTFEIKSDSCIYRTTIEKLILKSGYYQIVIFARCRGPSSRTRQHALRRARARLVRIVAGSQGLRGCS
jgi:hypothetical protein